MALGKNGGQLVIDIHGHINLAKPKAILEARQPSKHGKGGGEEGGGITDRSRNAILTDIDRRIADMDGMGVDMMALTPSPPRGFYKFDESLAGDIARSVNDEVAKVVADHPTRFVALGNLPVQHVAWSVKELERSTHELGHKGVRVTTNIAGIELGDRRFDPLWAKAQELGSVIFLHPQGFTEPERLADYFMTNVVGQPLETTLALAQMIFGGVFERFPDLKLCGSHGGGYLPFYLGRFEQAYRERAECRVHINKSPEYYVKKLWLDTVVFRPDQIAFIANLVGHEKIVMGTDSPYDMGENHPVELVKSTPGLNESQKADILGGNAARLLGLA
ncbi:MAG TPA: amidohydrolase family protein [Alphaproteobacteria bacterium]